MADPTQDILKNLGIAAPATPTTTPTAPAAVKPAYDYASIANLAAEAGVDISSIANLIGNPTTASMDAIYKSLGIDAAESAAFAKPSQSTEQMYNEMFQSSGLADLKAKMTELDTTISTQKQQLTDATGGVNENPWLSEASRMGRVKRLQDLAANTINNLIEQKGQSQQLYETGLGEINAAIGRKTTDFATNQSIASSQLSYLQNKAEKMGELAGNTQKEQLLRYMPDYLKKTVKVAKDKEKKAKEEAEDAKDEAYKQELKKAMISAGLSTKNSKGGSLKTKDMEKLLSKDNKQKLDDAKRAASAKASSSSGNSEAKDIQNFYADADKLRAQMNKKSANWAYAWNYLRNKYPSASIDFIDQTLGTDYRDKYDK